MGVCEFSSISHNLQYLLSIHDLNSIEGDFINSKYEFVIKSIPADHALGPDSFNGKFIRSC